MKTEPTQNKLHIDVEWLTIAFAAGCFGFGWSPFYICVVLYIVGILK